MIIRISLFIAFSFLLTATTSAQLTWGIRTGIQRSGVYGSTFTAKPNLTYFMPLPYLRYDFRGKLAVSEELAYERRGYKFNDGLTKTIFPFFSGYTLLHYKIDSKFSVFAGTQTSLVFNTVTISDGERFGQGAPYGKRFDLGAAVGVEWQASPGYNINLRYTQSLLHRYAFPYPADYRNYAIQLGLNSTVSAWHKRADRIVSFGVHQGIVSSTVQVLDNDDRPLLASSRKYRTGIESGLDVRFNISDYFYFATGITYFQRGGTFQNDQAVKLNYLSLPLIVGAVPFRSKYVSLSLDAGLGFNGQVGGKDPYLANVAQEPYEHKHTATYFYGAELSTDIIKNITLFAHYRRFYDNAQFVELRNGFNDYAYYQTRGESFSVGVRQRMARREKKWISKHDPEELVGRRSWFGVKLAAPIGWIGYNNKPSDAQSSPLFAGLTAGLTFKIRTGKTTSIVPEIQYAYVRPGVTAIENPILLSYAITKRFSLEGGGQWRIFLKSGSRNIGNYSENIGKPSDFGVLLGTQYKLTRHFSLGLRYYRSTVNNINWLDNGGYPQATGGSFRSLQAGGFFMF